MVRSKAVGRTAWRRGLLAALLLGVVLASTSCKATIGCRVISVAEQDAPSFFFVDDSACTVAPTPVVPEVPLPVVLPVLAGAVVAVVARRQVTRRRREVGSL